MPKVSTVKITQLVHPQIASAKLRALRDGAAIASKKLGSRIQECLCRMNEKKAKKSVGSRSGAVFRRWGLSVNRLFRLTVPHERHRKSVSSPRRFKPDMTLSVIRLS
jgi:hypothetical protein